MPPPGGLFPSIPPAFVLLANIGIPDAALLKQLQTWHKKTHRRLLDALAPNNHSPPSTRPVSIDHPRRLGPARPLFYLSLRHLLHLPGALFPPASLAPYSPFNLPSSRPPLTSILFSPRSSFHLSITAIHSKWCSCCQRDGSPRRTDRFIHAILQQYYHQGPSSILFTPTQRNVAQQ